MSDLTLTASADIRALMTGMQQIQNQLGQVKAASDRTEKAATKMEGSFSDLVSTGRKLIGVLGAGGLVGVVAKNTWEFATLGATIERATYTLDALTEGRANEFIKETQSALHGTVTEFEAASVAAKIYSLGVTDSAEGTAEFIRMASILGGTFRGLGTAEAAEEFALLISNMSYRRLDTFGISAAKVRNRVAELKNEVAGLSNEQAFQMATIEAMQEKSELLAGTMEDQAASVAELKAAWRELKEEMAKASAEAFLPTILSGIEAKHTAEDLAEEMVKSGASFEEYKAAVLETEKAHRGLAVTMYQAWEAAEDAYKLEEANRIVDHWQRSVYEAIDAAKAFEDQTEETTEEVYDHEKALEAVRERIEAWKQAQLDNLSVQESVASTMGDLTGQLHEYWFEQRNVAATGEAYFEVLKATGAELQLSGSAYDMLREKYGLATTAQLELEAATRLLGEAVAEGNLSVMEGASLFDELTSGQIEGVEGLRERMDELADSITDAGDRLVAEQPTMYETLPDDIAGVQDAEQVLIDKLQEQTDLYTNLGPIAEGSFKQMNEAAMAAVGGESGLHIAKSLTGGIMMDWQYLINHPYVKLTAEVVTVGEVPPGGGHQLGTLSAPGGLAMVGEAGPELVALPAGSRVFNADQTRRMGGGGGVSVGSITVNVTTAATDARGIARDIVPYLRSELRALGRDFISVERVQ